jgi:hypothetical protein
MRFNRRDAILGLIVIVLVIGGALLLRRYRANRVSAVATPTPMSIRKAIQEQFKFEVPANTNSTELNDVSGGDGRGLATEKEILVDLPDPDSKTFYQAWLENSSGQLVSLGKLTAAKGGWLINYDAARYPEHKKIVVSSESILDSTLEKRVLEGSF